MRARLAAPLAVLLLASGCTFTVDTTDVGYSCNGPGQCAGDLRCIHSACSDAGPTCGDYVLDPGEPCDAGDAHPEYCPYGSLVSCTACSLSCQPIAGTITWCGDGALDTWHGEQCDLAASNGLCGQSCDKECRSWSCDREWMWWTPQPDAPVPGNYDFTTAGVVFDTVTKLSWERAFNGTQYSYAGALAYCDSLSLAGYPNWRLPTRAELLSLVDYTIAPSSGTPAINATAFPATTAGWPTLSATVDAADGLKGWHVHFGTASYERGLRTDASYFVRCVH